MIWTRQSPPWPKWEACGAVHLHFTKPRSLFFFFANQPSRVKPLLTFGSGAGSMSHRADWLPLAVNAGLSWVSAAVPGGGKWVFVRGRGNRFFFFFFSWLVCLFWREEELCSTEFKCRRSRRRFKVIPWISVRGSLRVWICRAGLAETNSHGRFVLSLVLVATALFSAAPLQEERLNVQRLHSEMQIRLFLLLLFFALSPFLALMFRHTEKTLQSVTWLLKSGDSLRQGRPVKRRNWKGSAAAIWYHLVLLKSALAHRPSRVNA